MTGLRTAGESRAEALFVLLNTRYFQFTKRLPLSLEKLASLKDTYSGEPGEEPFESIACLNPVLAATPWLFWEVFQVLDGEPFLRIAEAGMYFVLASVVLDHLVDYQAHHPQPMSLLHQALFQHGITTYQKSLPAVSPFWQHFERLAALHLKGLATELEIQENPRRLDLDTLFTMAHGKVAPIVTTSAALAFASGQPEVLSPIETSLNHISVASQLLDDIGDWQDDLQAHHLTYYLSQCSPVDAWDADQWPSIAAVQAQINADWSDTHHMHLVVDLLEKAIEAVKDLPCPGWVDYVAGYGQRADLHLTNFYKVHIGQVFKPPNLQPH
jgi:hypothetical protein